MRTIKFRAWAEVDEIKSTCTDRMIYFDPMECDNGMWFNAPDNICHINEYHSLMQFTGLEDKNGNHIYEGDILYNGFNAKGVMRFEEGMFVCDFIYNNHKNKNHYKYEKHTFRINSINTVTEVIGNIYENPELL